MPNRPPQYCRYRGNYARVKLNGKWVHLGPYDDPDAHAEYKRLIALWALDSPPETIDEKHELTVAELLDGYLGHAERYYRHDSNHVGYLKRLIKVVRELYADHPAAEFGPRKLQTVREAFIRKGWVRPKVNEAVRNVIAIFSWGVEQEMIPGGVVHALREVRSLRRGHTDAPESRVVRAVPQPDVDATVAVMVPVLRDMITVQRLTGARPGEICKMTPGQIDRRGDVWLYRPAEHKTAHHGHDRVIPIGPKAQAVLRPYLLRAADSPCFSPREARAQHLDERHEQRTTPTHQGNRPDVFKRERLLSETGEQYDVTAYRHAVHRACTRAGVKAWSPHQLRHLTGDTVREQFGIDGVQAILGHRHCRISEVYAQINTEKAAEIARAIG